MEKREQLERRRHQLVKGWLSCHEWQGSKLVCQDVQTAERYFAAINELMKESAQPEGSGQEKAAE